MAKKRRERRYRTTPEPPSTVARHDNGRGNVRRKLRVDIFVAANDYYMSDVIYAMTELCHSRREFYLKSRQPMKADFASELGRILTAAEEYARIHIL